MDNYFLNKVKQTISDHLSDEKFGVGELAAEVGLSKSQTFRKIKSLTGKSISQIIKETRLQKAAKLLLESDLHASEISYKVGFNSPSYFNKCFHNYYGVTPGDYKENGHEIPLKDPFDLKPPSSVIKKFKFILYFLGTALILIPLIIYFSNKSLTSKTDPSNKSIAVLYFDDNSNESNQEWFCRGITEEIRSKLSNIKSLKVISSTSVKQYRNTKKSIPNIAKELDVDYILEGSVTWHNNKIKIFAQLINANDERIWTKEYNDDINDIFVIQQNVAKNIAQQLQIDLSQEEMKIIEKYPTDNMEAYNLFLQAEYQKSLFNKMAYNTALPLYENAIALDSNFVEAYMGLSEIWQIGGIVWGLYDESSAWKKSKQLLQKAKSIDGNNDQIEYDLHLGLFYFEWDFESMETYYQKRLLKSNYKILTGVIQDYAMKTGRYNEALLINERYIENSPTIKYIYAYKAEVLMFLGKKEAAAAVLEEYNPLFSDDMFYLRESTKLYFYLEEYKKSKNQLKKIRAKFPNDNPPIFIWLDAVFAHMDGKKEAAALFLDQLIDCYQTSKSGSPAWFIALYYGYLNDFENTFVWLQKSFDRHEVEMTWLREEPILIPLHHDVRYKELYDKIGFSIIK